MNLYFQEPHSVLLGTKKQWKGTGKKRGYTEVRDEMVYIPILETIQSLLKDPNVLKLVRAIGSCVWVIHPSVDRNWPQVH